MSEPIEVARIEITRVLTDDSESSDQVWLDHRDNSGERLPLVEVLGLLRMAEDSAIRMAMGEDDD